MPPSVFVNSTSSRLLAEPGNTLHYAKFRNPDAP